MQVFFQHFHVNIQLDVNCTVYDKSAKLSHESSLASVNHFCLNKFDRLSEEVARCMLTQYFLVYELCGDEFPSELREQIITVKLIAKKLFRNLLIGC